MTRIFSLLGKLSCGIAVTVILASVSAASAQQSFKSPEDAVADLVSATRDNWLKGVVAVLGADGVDIVSSGDKVADEAMRQKFLAAYDAKHEVKKERRRQGCDNHRQRGFSVPHPVDAQGRGLAIRHGRWPP